MSRKSKKLISAILLSGVIMCGCPGISMARTCDVNSVQSNMSIINPRLTYIVDTECDFSIVGGKAIADCWVKGDISDATKSKVIVELQLESGANNWIAYATWVDTQNSFRAAVKESKTVTTGQTYRVKATYTVWEGSQSETIVVFSDEVTA